jgi:hypothetical protein
VSTPAQLRRQRKKHATRERRTAELEARIRDGDVPYVRCLGCGWVGFDVSDDSWSVEDPEFQHLTPCPSCGHEEAEYALTLQEWDALWRR